jgi:NAD(P)-dependent dehydrogenase (short-subunit alcohol dehydrogenase family)
VVVTGAASGIGRGIAIAAAKHGTQAVIVSDVTENPREGGTPTVEEIEALGVTARFHRTDVTRRGDVDSLVTASAEFGGVDVMVCNAGIMLGDDGADVAEDDFHRLMAVNVDGVLFGAQAAAKQMKANGKSGSIVFIASLGGLVGNGHSVGYTISKGGVVLMAKSLADALGPDGIRVNAVCPGVIDTQLLRGPAAASTVDVAAAMIQRTPLRRVGRPADIGDAVAWLGSDFASFVSGVALPVDGGLLAAN